MDARMDGRVALVTGGSQGLGLAMAKEFAASGADVAIFARRPEIIEIAVSEISAGADGRKVRGYACDVSDAKQITENFSRVIEDFGRVDVLVNNAGSSNAQPFLDVSDEEWQYDLELKLFGAIRLCRLAIPGMRERRWGRIINVLNTGAKTPRGNSVPTTVSRAAGMALTKVLANEGAPFNILVNGLCTGVIVSEQHHRSHQRDAPETSFEEYSAKRGEAYPLGRMGQAEEFANMACFLASDAGSFITGTAINVDGGLSPVM